MRVSADVHAPTPRRLISTRSRASPSVRAGGARARRCRRGARPRRSCATAAARDRLDASPTTGCDASPRMVGGANIGCGVGPGARSPNQVTRLRQAEKACRPVTFCSMTELANASNTSPVRPMRRPGLRRCTSATSGCLRRRRIRSGRRPPRTARAARSSAHAGSRPPGGGTDHAARHLPERQRRDARRRAAHAPDHRSVERHRGIADAVPLVHHGAPEVERMPRAVLRLERSTVGRARGRLRTPRRGSRASAGPGGEIVMQTPYARPSDIRPAALRAGARVRSGRGRGCRGRSG